MLSDTCKDVFLQFETLKIDFLENQTGSEDTFHDVIRLNNGARIIDSTITGPVYVDRNSLIGPGATVGKYTGFNADCHISRATIGSFCAIGARNGLNPFNHPIDWLSTHEFQYHPKAFDWMEEYREFDRLERTPDMFHYPTFGSDIWTGHNVNVMGGVSIGHGAIIAAGAVVTRDVPPYAIVAGLPAKIIRYRFDEKTIERLLAVRWWDFDLPKLSGLNFRNIDQVLPVLENMRASEGAETDS